MHYIPLTDSWILINGTATCYFDETHRLAPNQNIEDVENGRVFVIGIAPWGKIRDRKSFTGLGNDVNYQLNDDPYTESIALNNQHDYFLFADDGTVGKSFFFLFHTVINLHFISNIQWQLYRL